jgi:hypothetical protein
MAHAAAVLETRCCGQVWTSAQESHCWAASVGGLLVVVSFLTGSELTSRDFVCAGVGIYRLHGAGGLQSSLYVTLRRLSTRYLHKAEYQ